MADVKFLISVDTAAGTASLKQFSKEVEGLGTTTAKTTEQHGFLNTQLGALGTTMLASVGIVSIVHKAWGALNDLMRDAVTGAIAEEKSEMGLRSALALTGREAQANATHYLNYAESLMRTTVYTHEQVEGVQTLLLQLTRLDREGLDKATRGAIGLASALGMDLHSAAMMVTKAMEGNYTALARVGIKVNETGTAQEKQAELLSKLEVLWGRAGAEAATFGGKVEQAKIQIGELKEKLGAVIIESSTFQAILKDITGIFRDLNTIVEHGATSLDKYLNVIPMFREFNTTLTILSAKLRLHAEELKHNGINVEIWGKKFDDVLKNLAPGVRKFFADAIESYDKLHKGIDPPGGGVFVTLSKDAAKAKTTVGSLAHIFMYAAVPALVETESKARQMGMVLDKAVEQLGQQVVWTIGNLKKLKLTFEETTRFIQQNITTLFGSWSELSRNQADTEIANLNRSYDERKQKILDSMLDEETKAAMIKNLETEQALATRKIQREQAHASKSLAIFEAVANMAVAFTMALRSLPPPWSFIQAALVVAAGAIQIAAIKAQPIPLAQGGIFTRPTHIMAEAGAEAVIPLDRIGDVARRMGIGGGRVTHLHQHIYFGGQKIKEQILEIVERASGEGTLKIRAKAIA
jgi:hypothetical protein